MSYCKTCPISSSFIRAVTQYQFTGFTDALSIDLPLHRLLPIELPLMQVLVLRTPPWGGF